MRLVKKIAFEVYQAGEVALDRCGVDIYSVDYRLIHVIELEKGRYG